MKTRLTSEHPLLLIAIGGHLATAPRPQKEAAEARNAGFQVVIYGVWWSERLANEDLEIARNIGVEFVPVVDLRISHLSNFSFRVKQRLAVELYKWFGFVSPRCFGLAAPEMLRAAVRLKPDLTMVHSEAGLWVGKQLLKRGYRVGVDFEDWFSEDLPMAERKGRPIMELKRLERFLLTEANPVLTTTKVMAEAMASDAECERLPTVIPNCFPWSGAPREGEGTRYERDPEAVSFYWFSQTIGPGRGLEMLAGSLSKLQGKWELHLRGDIRGYRAWLDSIFPAELSKRIHVHPPVPNIELASRSASHDVGLALEIPYCPNKQFTASNKIFEYLRCGLAVVATDTKGQCEVMSGCPDAGWVIPSGDIEALAKCLQLLIDEPKHLQSAKAKALDAASNFWAWETHSQRLREVILTSVDLHGSPQENSNETSPPHTR